MWSWIQRALVCALALVHLAVLAAQSTDFVPLAWVELTRFLPFYWLLVPTAGALVLSIGLPWRYALVSIANGLLLLTVTMGFSWSQQIAADQGVRLRVLSYNVKALSARHREDGFTEIDQEVRRHVPDLVALQDAQGWVGDKSGTEPSAARPLFGLPHVVAMGQYVLASKYPLQECKAAALGKTDLGPDADRYLQCKVQIGDKTVQLINVHFVSPRSALVAVKTNPVSGFPVWVSNLSERVRQAQGLLADLTQVARPLVVMGDLNAQEGSVVVNTLKLAGLRDTFSAAGRGWGYTHGHALRGGVDFLRIDHVLVSPDVGVERSIVGEEGPSEHKAVVADLLF